MTNQKGCHEFKAKKKPPKIIEALFIYIDFINS